MSAMRRTLTILKRELASYFAMPLAWVAIVVFLVLGGILTFFVGDFFERGQADLQAFFSFNPWLYLVLVPALSVGAWAQEHRSGTIELLLTLPLRVGEAVIGKFLAVWCVVGIALLLSFPLWLTVNYLGHPDNAVIAVSYLASWLMAGAMLAIGAAVSAAGRNQVIVFLIVAGLIFVWIAAGTPTAIGLLRGWAPAELVAGVAGASLSGHFAAVTRGTFEVSDLVYFPSLIIAFLAASVIIVDLNKAQ